MSWARLVVSRRAFSQVSVCKMSCESAKAGASKVEQIVRFRSDTLDSLRGLWEAKQARVLEVVVGVVISD